MLTPLLLLLAICFPALAQHSEQPVKESHTDLRAQQVLFSVEEVKEKKTFILERTTNFDYFLRARVGKDETIKKVPGRVAQKLDLNFASRFLRCQYEIPASEGKCQPQYKLLMKGEGQEICEKDDKKSQEIKSFLTELSALL
jgi:hypothetical protein